MLKRTGKMFCIGKGAPPPPINLKHIKYINSFCLKKSTNLENLALNFFSIKSLKKVFAKRYNKNPPIVLPNININVPNHLPKIKPPSKATGLPNPSKRIQKIVKAKNLMHGKTSKIKHNKKGLFKNIQNNFEATRYHSLIVDRKNFPKNLIITAETKNKTIMGLMHKDYNIHGFQFHPESISTKMGMKLIKNFIAN